MEGNFQSEHIEKFREKGDKVIPKITPIAKELCLATTVLRWDESATLPSMKCTFYIFTYKETNMRKSLITAITLLLRLLREKIIFTQFFKETMLKYFMSSNLQCAVLLVVLEND